MQTKESVTRFRELRLFWRTLSRNPITFLGLALIILVTFTAVFAPHLAPYSYDEVQPGARLKKPSRVHLLGTDHLARDVLSRMVYGARPSLIVGMLSTSFSAIMGVLIGAIAGYLGKWVDEAIMRLMDIIMAFPAIVLGITLVALVGPSLQNLVFVIGILHIPHFARLSRGSVLSLKEKEFVLASKAVGQREWRIVLFHILPNTLTPIVVMASLSIASAILTEAGLSYLGLGIRPPQPSWGTMLKDGQQYMLTAPWVATFPGIAISLALLGFNLFGDGLRDALDPKTRGGLGRERKEGVAT